MTNQDIDKIVDENTEEKPEVEINSRDKVINIIGFSIIAISALVVLYCFFEYFYIQNNSMF